MTVLPSVSQPDNRPQIVRDAIARLDEFCKDRNEAALLLPRWGWSDGLTDAQVLEVLDHFPPAIPFEHRPCPAWCQVDDHPDDELRTHEVVVLREPVLNLRGEPTDTRWVCIARCDTALNIDDEEAGKVGAIEVDVQCSAGHGMDQAAARRLADAIVEAARLVEQLTTPAGSPQPGGSA